ncbi:MAG: hypothetical protein K8I30_06900, partial [Anaerolineae bacterium]|nr:hypothetical protein [Anaerolineae bacterium]
MTLRAFRTLLLIFLVLSAAGSVTTLAQEATVELQPIIEEATPAVVPPTEVPTDIPTEVPTEIPPPVEITAEPTVEIPTEPPAEVTAEPTAEPTVEPTAEMTTEPTAEVTTEPTAEVTAEPTVEVTPTAVPLALLFSDVLEGSTLYWTLTPGWTFGGGENGYGLT